MYAPVKLITLLTYLGAGGTTYRGRGRVFGAYSAKTLVSRQEHKSRSRKFQPKDRALSAPQCNAHSVPKLVEIEGLELSFQKLQELESLLLRRLGYQSLKSPQSIALIGRLFTI